MDQQLLLQQMERALVRAHVAEPEVLDPVELRRLRYLISFARLGRFEPGAALPDGGRGRAEVDVAAELASWQQRVIDTLTGPLRHEGLPGERLSRARAAFTALEEEMDAQRGRLLDAHRGDFSEAELDAEVGRKSLVVVLGGGGGAGYVYIGAMQRFVEAGLVPDYLVGGSIGAVLGSVFVRQLPIPFDDYIEFAHSLTYRSLLGPEPLRRRHGLTSVLSLRFDEFAAPMFEAPDGRQLRMKDTAIPFDTVVSGVHKELFKKLPASFRRQEIAALKLRSLPVRPIGLGPQVTRRLWQVASFIDARMVKPLVLGNDELTRELTIVDAASFSAAIPGVLHHETKDPEMVPILDELLAAKDVAALVDGVAASNVPAEQAWIMVQRGRIGTRNATYLALDCFHPQLDPRHLWLTPITRAVNLQMVRNAPYCDYLLETSPTLSPLTLAPSTVALEQAIAWGRASAEEALPFVLAMQEPVWWSGDAPSFEKVRRTAAVRGKAPSMKPLILAARASRARLRDWRDRHFT